MSAWGGNSAFKSCETLLRRLEENDPNLQDVVILSNKTFGTQEVKRLIAVLEGGNNYHWRSLTASGHTLPPDSLYHLGKTIARSSFSSTSFSSLAIGDSSMGDEGVHALCEGLMANTKNTKITGLDNKVEENPKDSNLDKSSFSLEILDLSYKGMGSKGFLSILRLLSSGKSKKLKQLNLSRNPGILKDWNDCYDNKGETEGGNNNNNNLSLHFEDLDLSDCGLDRQALNVLNCLLKPMSSRCKLRLSHNPLGGGGGNYGTLLKNNLASSLEEISLCNCNISDRDLELLFSFVDTDTTTAMVVKILDLSDNKISHDGVAILARHLYARARRGSSPGSAVTEKSPPGPDKDSNCCSEVVCRLPSLSKLNLSGNALSSAGVLALIDGLRARRQEKLPELIAIDLSETQCDVSGAIEAVRYSGASTLRLFNNRLGPTGFRAIAESFASIDDVFDSNVKEEEPLRLLSSLDLAGNHADQASSVDLLDALSQNKNSAPNLKTLVIGGNEGGDNVEKMVDLLQKSRPELDVARDKRKGADSS